MKKLVLFFLSLFLVSAFTAFGVTRHVPGTYPTIQAAINASVPGDVVQIAAGNFVESLTVAINDLTIQGAGPTLTTVKTLSGTPGITVYGNNLTLKNLRITNNTQTREGIRVLSPAAYGFYMDGVYITNIGYHANNAFGVRFMDEFTGVDIRNCQFSATMASGRAMAVYSPNTAVTQSNWHFEGNLFQYLYTGVYINSSVDGLVMEGNNFGPWDLADCRQAASGLYIGDGGANFTIDNVKVIGNTFNNYARGVYFLNNAAGQQIGETEITNNIFTNSIWSSGVRIVAGTALFGMYAPAILEGPVTVCNNSFTQNTPVSNGSGVAMIDFRTVTGGESSTSVIDVCNNDINFTGSFTLSTWGLLLRGPLNHASITGNTFSGNNAGGASPDMPPTSGIVVQTNYLDYGPMKPDAIYSIQNNSFTGFENGISVYDMLNKVFGGLPAGATIAANNNAIFGNVYGIYSGVGEITNAYNNWWGDSSGPYHSTNPGGLGNPVTDYVAFLPWWCDAAMTTVCPQPAPGDAILNVNTGIWYPKTGLHTALYYAGEGHTLYVAPGEVDGAGYNQPGKTVHIIGSGLTGQSTITGPGRALTIADGHLTLGNGLELNTDNPYGGSTAYKTIMVQGGSLKVRDCKLVEDASSYQSILGVEAGSVDAGTMENPGNNLFLVNGPGAALYNVPFVPVDAIGNDWGSTLGPTIGTNPGGNGGELIGAGNNFILYSPWKSGPVTAIPDAIACNGAVSVDVPVTVSSFDAVGSVNLMITYDPAQVGNPVLSYQDPLFAGWGNLQLTNVAPGTLSVNGTGAWPHTGITLDDDAVIFTLTFDVLPGAATTALTFLDDLAGTACQYTGPAPFYMEFGDRPHATHYIDGSITYDPNPPLPVSVTIVASGNPVAPGDPVTLTATPVNGGTTPHYQWVVKGVNVGDNLPTYSYVPAYGDDVKVILTSSEPCVTGSPATSNIIVLFVLEPFVTVSDTVADEEALCFDAGQVLTVGGPPNAFLVEAGGSATLIAGQMIKMLPGTVVQPGGYLHAYIAAQGPFCTPVPLAPQINPNPEPEVFSADPKAMFKVYPNPTRGDFTLVQRDNEVFENVTMYLYSMQGTLVMTRTLNDAQQFTFSAAGLSGGLYFIRLVSANHTETMKLIRAD